MAGHGIGAIVFDPCDGCVGGEGLFDPKFFCPISAAQITRAPEGGARTKPVKADRSGIASDVDPFWTAGPSTPIYPLFSFDNG